MKTMKTKDRKTEVALSRVEGAATSHHPYGPSRWPALLECPCWESKPPTEQTERGTALHTLFERAMKGEEVEVTDSLEWHVLEAAREIRRCAVPDKHGFLTEQVVPIPGTLDMTGRLDVGWIDAVTGDIHVADLKLAWNPQRDHTAQLLCYAIGLLGEFGDGSAGPRIHLRVVYADGSEGSVQTFKTAQAIEQHLRNADRIRDIAGGDADMTPRQCGWCELCSKFTSCPEMKSLVDKASPMLADSAKPERWADFTSKQKARACAIADTVSRWCEAVKSQAAEDAKAGELIEDAENCIFYAVQERRGRFVIPDVQAAWKILKQRLTAEKYRACLSVNQSALRMALKEVGVKLSDINALIEQCGSRLPDTTVFVRRGLKESA